MAENRKDAFLILFEKIAKKGREDPFSATKRTFHPYGNHTGMKKYWQKRNVGGSKNL